MRKIVARAVTAAGIVVMAEFSGSMRPIPYINQETACVEIAEAHAQRPAPTPYGSPEPEGADSKGITAPRRACSHFADYFRDAFVWMKQPVAPDTLPPTRSHPPTTTKKIQSPTLENYSFESAGGPPKGEPFYTLTLRPVPATTGAVGRPYGIDKIGEPLIVGGPGASWLYGHESDLNRLEEGLLNVLHLPGRQVENLVDKLRVGVRLRSV